MALTVDDRPTVRRIGWYGCKASMPSFKDKPFKPRAVRVPRVIDLREHFPPVMNQGNLGSCVAHGITTVMRYEMKKKGAPDVELARLQLYFDGRVVEDCVNEDTGLEIRDGMKCAMKIGVAHEELWPYKIDQFAQKPTDDVYVDAEKLQVVKFERVPVDRTCINLALAMGHPVIIGINLFDSFESKRVEDTGMVPMPKLRESSVGGHCMVVWGRGQKEKRYGVRNSWDSNWGDKGDCYIPEEYIGSPKFGSDYWIIKDVEVVAPAPTEG